MLDLFFGVPPVVPALTRPPILLDTGVLRSWGIRHAHTVVVACAYDQSAEVAHGVRLLKYGRLARMAESLSVLLDPCLEELEESWGEAVLCPVPLHWRRRMGRGFNQSQLLARALGRRQGMEVCSLLTRRRATGTQVGRTGEERRRALTDAFLYKNRGQCPESVILIDDIFTTGATMDACAAALRAAGVKNVAGIAVALG